MTQSRYKTVTIGNSSVGKSSVIMRLCQGIFIHQRESTIGASFLTHKVSAKDKNNKDVLVKFEIWDTAGQERYKALIPMYIRDAQLILFVFDLTDKNTFDKILDYWMPEVLEKTDSEKCVYYIFGNKNDLYETGNYHNIDNYIKERLKDFKGVKYFKTSAKTGENITEVFVDAGSTLLKRVDWSGNDGSGIVNVNANDSTSGGCCY